MTKNLDNDKGEIPSVKSYWLFQIKICIWNLQIISLN